MEQPHAAVAVDQYVRRLEVAVDDQVAVRIGHRFADIAEKPQSRRKIGVMGPAPRVDRLAGHIFHRHIGPPVWRDTAVDQPRNPRVLESGEQARSEENTSELQSLMRISYAVFCLQKNTN